MSTPADKGHPVKLRSACDLCHKAKVRCSGGLPCAKCCKEKAECRYSTPAKVGKPKGSKNKKTITRELAAQRVHTRQESALSTSSIILPQLQQQKEHDGSITGSGMWPDISQALDHHPNPLGVSYSECLMTGHDVLPLETNAFDHLMHLDAAAATNHTGSSFSAEFDDFNGLMHVDHRRDSQSHMPCESLVTSTSTGVSEGRSAMPHPVPMSVSSSHRDDLGPMPSSREEADESDAESDDLVELLTGQHDPVFSRRSSLSVAQLGQSPHGARRTQPLSRPSPAVRRQDFSQDGRLQPTTKCSCLLHLTSRLYELREIEVEQAAIHLDTIQHFASRNCHELQKALTCTSCLQDIRCLQIAAILIRTIMSWINDAQDQPKTANSSMPATRHGRHGRHETHPSRPGSSVISSKPPTTIGAVRVGSYTVNEEDSAVVEIVLISRLLSRTQTVIKSFTSRIDQATEVVDPNFQPIHQIEVDHLKAISHMISKQFKGLSRSLKEPYAAMS